MHLYYCHYHFHYSPEAIAIQENNSELEDCVPQLFLNDALLGKTYTLNLTLKLLLEGIE